MHFKKKLLRSLRGNWRQRHDAKVLSNDKIKLKLFQEIKSNLDDRSSAVIAKSLVNNYFNFEITEEDLLKATDFSKCIVALNENKISKNQFVEIAQKIHQDKSFDDIAVEFIGSSDNTNNIVTVIDSVLANNPKEVERYKAGEKQLTGFFMGQAMKEAKGKGNPAEINKILREKLDK